MILGFVLFYLHLHLVLALLITCPASPPFLPHLLDTYPLVVCSEIEQINNCWDLQLVSFICWGCLAVRYRIFVDIP